MALLSGFDALNPASNTFSDWLSKTNEMINLMRTEVVTANTSMANTDGNMNLNGSFTANVVYIADEIFGGEYDFNGASFVSANLTISTNTTFSNTVNEVYIENDLRIESGDLHYILQPNNYVDLVPETTGFNLGNTTNRWDLFSTNIETDGSILPTANSIPLGNTTSRFDGFFEDLDISSTLTVSGNASFVDTNIDELTVSVGATLSNVTITDLSVTGLTGDGSTLSISSNTDVTGNLTVSETLSTNNFSIDGTLNYVMDDSNYVNLIPTNSGDLLGNTTNRWDGYFNDVDIENNLSVSNTATIDTLVVTTAATLPEGVELSGTATFENIEVSNTANIQNISVYGLQTNTAAIVGDVVDVSVNTAVVIDSFDKTITRGLKYLVHGTNADPSSTFIVEILCAHNDTNIFATRYGELSNSFDVIVEPSINGANLELEVICSSASGSNVHSFNIVRIETRNNT